jgi:hypothetical protein
VVAGHYFDPSVAISRLGGLLASLLFCEFDGSIPLGRVIGRGNIATSLVVNSESGCLPIKCESQQLVALGFRNLQAGPAA